MTEANLDSIGEKPSIRRHLLGGTIIALLLTAGLGGWAASTELAGAVVASGTLVVNSNVKKVQHPTGGIVAELNVHEGMLVHGGDVVVRLDDTTTRANLAIVAKGIDDMRARKARLLAERDGSEMLKFPDDLTARINEPDVADALDSERKLFDLRRNARAGQKSQLQKRIGQLEEEINGHLALQDAKSEEIKLIQRELDGVRDLWDKKLVQLTRLTALEREETRLKGERAQSISASAAARGKVLETDLQIIQVDQDLSSEVAKELRDVESKIGEYTERKIAAEDQLKRIDIRAPQDGYVLQLSVHTVGGVISAGDVIMQIVPQADDLAVEAKVPPQEIDQLHIGQLAGLRFSAFNQRTTPEINGTIDRISADITSDQRTGQNYYTVRVALPKEERAKLGNAKLVPGMPVEMFAKTYDRTVLSYFVKPLHDQAARAFRER
ncbi:HlyD family type I secretion periplasmic adaptor subunit [Rhodoplanes sp. Z2-YC6860]|uniref:HlyD family type I secretion periplasmic adaptor subunit n=1 Tax=Rhodoplanes sp. Z2-YC6860 TaxID=674703 RepID=UPI00078E0474|nr:HlyD family type I secretion periplasmic adaptor subunit [Rhodoplanes sp. Z2-YC6860]AMN39761.1 HlyD family secretion protein [Rhodoplanes sp. Z2-YC6860]